MDNKIIKVLKPTIVENADNDLVRMNVVFRIPNNDDYTVFWEVQKEYAEYLSIDVCDFCVFLALPMCLKIGYDIECDFPISEQFFYNLSTVLIPNIVSNDKSAKSFKIKTKRVVETNKGIAVGTGVSGGIDSTHTIVTHLDTELSSMNLSHLLVSTTSVDLCHFNSDDNLYTWVDKHLSFFRIYEKISKYTKLPIIKIFTNSFYFLCRTLDRPNWPVNFKHVNIHTYLTMSSVLALKHFFRGYYFSSSNPYNEFKLENCFHFPPSYYELLIVHSLTTDNFWCYSAGASESRIDKTIYLADNDIAREVVHPCFQPGEKNCSNPKCKVGNKCLRALLTLDYYDKLDNFSKVFDIERYKTRKKEYFIEMVKTKSNHYINELYNLMQSKYPKQVHEAEIEVQYEGLIKKCLENIELLEDIISKLVDKNVYFVGKSSLSMQLFASIESKLNLYRYPTDPSFCDCALITCVDTLEIKKAQKYLLNKNPNIKIYTIESILN